MTLGAMVWKETREQLLRGGRPVTSVVVSMVSTVFVAGVLPFVFGRGLPGSLGTGLGLSIAAVLGFGLIAFLSMMTPLAVVIDTIAGERERHTLETLLASPASDRAILLGKALPIGFMVVANAVWYGLVSLASLTILYGVPGLLVALALLFLGPVVGLIPASFTTGLGLFLSQRAPTIKQGQQWLGYCMMPFFLLPGLVGPLVSIFARRAGVASPITLAVVGIAAAILLFVVLNVLFWVLSFARFRRDRLLLR